MTIAIRRENGDILWFDAVEGFDEVLSSMVTKHPIATGSFVADHITKDNPKFTLRGVLSDADFNFNRPQLDYNATLNVIGLGQEEVTFPMNGVKKQYTNNTPVDNPVSINSNKNTFKSFLPEAISQFTSTSIPEVVVTEQPKVKSASAVRLDLVRIREMKEEFTLVDYEDNLIRRSWSGCVLVNLSFSEDADGGDSSALFPVMEIEQVVYTNVENVRIKLKPVNKGRQQGAASKRDTVEGDDAKTQPTNLSGGSSEALKASGLAKPKPKFGDAP
jgi:hypothetical protein